MKLFGKLCFSLGIYLQAVSVVMLYLRMWSLFYNLIL